MSVLDDTAADIRKLKWATRALAVCVAVLAAPWLMAASRNKVDDLTVRSVRVVDDNGVVRAVLAGNVPDPIIEGRQATRAGSGGGLIIYDKFGNERGGYMIDDQGEGLLTLDDEKGREVFKVVGNAKAGASLFLPHENGAGIAVSTYRGAPEIHLLKQGGRPATVIPEGTPPLR